MTLIYLDKTLYSFLQMLNVAVSGHTATSFDSAMKCVSELWQDDEYENLRKNGANYHHMTTSDSSSSVSSGGSDKNKHTVPEKPPDNEAVKLAARLVCIVFGLFFFVFIPVTMAYKRSLLPWYIYL